MDINTILIAVSIITTGIVGGILKSQINSQKQTIDNLDLYIKTTDWKKVKEYYEDFLMPSEKNKAAKPYVDQTEELVSYIRNIFLKATDIGIDFNSVVDNALPHCKQYFQDIIDQYPPNKTDEQLNTVEFHIPDL